MGCSEETQRYARKNMATIQRKEAAMEPSEEFILPWDGVSSEDGGLTAGMAVSFVY